MPQPLEESVVLELTKSLSNWGRWGNQDQIGALNFITDGVRAKAMTLAREGISVSCSRDIISNKPEVNAGVGAPQRFMETTGEGLTEENRYRTGRQAPASEWVGMRFHGLIITHLDALAHVFWDGQMYNGVSSDAVTSRSGATQSSVLGAREGIVTRGVVLDVAAVRGRPWLEPGDAVYPEDLEAAEKAQGVRVQSGDFVLLNTGYSRQIEEEGPVPISQGQAGWQAACLPWLHDREVAGIGSDTANDVTPSGYSEIPNPMHVIGIVAMGVWLLDNCNLVHCVEMCQRLQRWEFLFVVGPLRLEGGTGSPVNPLALF